MKYRQFNSKLNEYGFETYITSKFIEIYPAHVPENNFLTLALRNNKAHIHKHRNNALTLQFFDRVVSSEWIISFCKHNSKQAKNITNQALQDTAQKLVQEEEEKERIREKGIEARENAEKQRQNEIDKRAKYADKQHANKPGYGHDARICPLCKGDGGVRECFRCDGTGWIR